MNSSIQSRRNFIQGGIAFSAGASAVAFAAPHPWSVMANYLSTVTTTSIIDMIDAVVKANSTQLMDYYANFFPSITFAGVDQLNLVMETCNVFAHNTERVREILDRHSDERQREQAIAGNLISIRILRDQRYFMNTHRVQAIPYCLASHMVKIATPSMIETIAPIIRAGLTHDNASIREMTVQNLVSSFPSNNQTLDQIRRSQILNLGLYIAKDLERIIAEVHDDPLRLGYGCALTIFLKNQERLAVLAKDERVVASTKRLLKKLRVKQVPHCNALYLLQKAYDECVPSLTTEMSAFGLSPYHSEVVLGWPGLAPYYTKDDYACLIAFNAIRILFDLWSKCDETKIGAPNCGPIEHSVWKILGMYRQFNVYESLLFNKIESYCESYSFSQDREFLNFLRHKFPELLSRDSVHQSEEFSETDISHIRDAPLWRGNGTSMHLSRSAGDVENFFSDLRNNMRELAAGILATVSAYFFRARLNIQ